MKPQGPLFAPPDITALSLAERCQHFAQQIADYEAAIDNSGLLELSAIRETLQAAAGAIQGHA